MSPVTKRRILIFSTGLMFGSIIAFGLYRFAEQNRQPRQVDKVLVAISKCDLKAGEPLTEDCVEERTVASNFVPPETLLMRRLPLFLGKNVTVDVPIGNAIREADF